MAVSALLVFGGKEIQQWEVTATLDADTIININHQLQVPAGDGLFVFITSMQQAVGELSAWAVLAANDTDIQLEKSVAVGSGNAAAQLRVWAVVQQARRLG